VLITQRRGRRFHRFYININIIDKRQINGKCGAFAKLTADADIAPVIFDDAVDDG